MWKCIGILFLIGGTAGTLYSWVCEEKSKLRYLEDTLLFLQKSLYVIQEEKIKVSDWFRRYIDQETVIQSNRNVLLERALEEMIKRLSVNTYPNGQMVWEEVFREEEQNLNIDREVFQCIVQAGNGFFGRSRTENISFLEKSIKELEQQLEKLKEKNLQERKVWIPVGMLGSIMLVILFL